MARRVRAKAAALCCGSVLLGSLLLAGCGGNSHADSLGKQACTSVERSLSLFAESESASNSTVQKNLANRASQELRNALQPAALAGSEDGDWEALEMTIAESSRVPEKELVTALSAQCASSVSANS